LNRGLFLSVFLYCLPFGSPLGAQAKSLPVVKLEGMKDVFQHGGVFVAGQPNLETLRALKEKGVKLVVNVRDEKEVKEHANAAFQDEAMVKELGMAYLWLPLADKASYTPAAVEHLAKAMNANPGKTLIHCAVGGRATVLYMAYLVRHGGFSLDEAFACGKQMRYSFFLEDLLGSPVSMTTRGAGPSWGEGEANRSKAGL
jgi:uncharacterized protein (TIGR01244 family)